MTLSSLDTVLNQAIDKRLQGALLRIRGDHPFFGTLALFADFVVTEEVKTASTDGRRLFFNPEFVVKQNLLQLCGLIAHELLHAGLQHVTRRRERDPELWNISADIVVNGMIVSDTNYTLPEGGVEYLALAHLSVEEIYEQLQSGKLKRPSITMLDLLGNDVQGVIAGDQTAELQRHWRSALQQASAVARRINKGIGRHGLNSQRDVVEANNPSLNWQNLLWQFLVATPCDFSGFDRRFIWQKLYIEEVVGESVDVAIVVDTSASIGNKELGAFLGEIEGILNAYPQMRGHLFYADADLYGPYPFSRDMDLPSPKGGGGTSFVPFFNWVKQQGDRGEFPLCIYFSDGFGTFPTHKPEVPVLWVVMPGGIESGGFPFGDVVRIGVGQT